MVSADFGDDGRSLPAHGQFSKRAAAPVAMPTGVKPARVAPE
jgi:hypothetical protein